MRKIRIMFVLFTSLKLGTGTENTVYNYIKNLPKDIFDITLLDADYAPFENISNEAVDKLKNSVSIVTIEPYYMKFNKSIRGGKLLIFLKEWLLPMYFMLVKIKLRNKLKNLGKFDVIYLAENSHQSLFKKNSDMIIGSLHCWVPNRNSTFGRIKLALISSGLVWRNIGAFHLFPSHAWFKDYLQSRKSFVLQNGADLDYFYPVAHTDGKVRVLYNSRLEPCKGIAVVVDFLKDTRKFDNVEFNIIGSGSYEDNVREINRPNVNFLGRTDQKTLADYFRRSDVFLAPTECDTFSLVVAQALACGTPCIVGKMLKGVFDDFEEIGYVKYINQSKAELSMALEEVISKLPELTKVREKAIEIAKEKFDWKKVSSELVTDIIRCVDAS